MLIYACFMVVGFGFILLVLAFFRSIPAYAKISAAILWLFIPVNFYILFLIGSNCIGGNSRCGEYILHFFVVVVSAPIVILCELLLLRGLLKTTNTITKTETDES